MTEITERTTRPLAFAWALILAGGNILGQSPPKDWKGTISEEDGVRIVMNPARPLFGEMTVELDEDLIIGNADDENACFYGAIDFAVDGAGHIYVLDMRECRVNKFGPDGEFIFSVGRAGQGPGEFDSPMAIEVDDGDNVYVSDRRGITVFSGKGDLIRKVGLNFYFEGLSPLDINAMYTFFYLPKFESETRERQLILIDAHGKIIKEFEKLTESMAIIRKEKHIITSYGSMYSHRPFVARLGGGRAAYAHSSEYALDILDKQGRLVHRIRVDEKPRPIPEKEKERLIKELMDLYQNPRRKGTQGVQLSRAETLRLLNFPEHMPFFFNVLGDGEGNVYVMNSWATGLGPGPRHVIFDVFDRDGIFIRRLVFPFMPMVIANNYVYTPRFDDDEGFWTIRRFRIRTDSQLLLGFIKSHITHHFRIFQTERFRLEPRFQAANRASKPSNPSTLMIIASARDEQFLVSGAADVDRAMEEVHRKLGFDATYLAAAFFKRWLQ